MTQISGNEDSCTPLQKGARNFPEFRVKFLAFLAFLHIRKSQEKARKSQECPGPLAFQEFLEKPGEPRKKISSLSRLFLMCKKARSFWLEWLLAHPGSSLIPGFPGKPRKAWKNQKKISTLSGQESPERKFPRFPGFSLCAKKPGASDWNDFWHILPFPWFRRFLESLEKPGKAWKSQEKIYHMALLAPPWLRGYPESLEKPREDFPHCTLRLLLNCRVSWKAWKSQEKTLRLLLAGSTESYWGFLESLEKPGKLRKNFQSFSCQRSWNFWLRVIFWMSWFFHI